MEIPQFKSNFFFETYSRMVSLHCTGSEYKRVTAVSTFILTRGKILKLRMFLFSEVCFFFELNVFVS